MGNQPQYLPLAIREPDNRTFINRLRGAFPGSYMKYNDENLNAYCIGSVGDSTADDVSAGPKMNVNPFLDNPKMPTKPDILVSNNHVVSACSATIDGAEFAIDKGKENSRAANTTVDIAVEGKAAYIVAGVNGGYGWGESYSRGLSEGVSFSAGIGNIENPDLVDEGYDWRMFLCNAKLHTNTGRTTEVRVLSYTVDNYAGSGGLEQLGPVTAVAPTQSEFTELTPTLTWEQESGTVRSYDWQLEAIGAHDTRSGSVTYTSTTDSAENRTAQTSAEVTDDLLPNQLYRWRVVATDFFGNTAASSWEYFVTEGPPKADFSFSPSTAKVGTPVVFTDTSHSGGLPIAQSWTFPDNSVLSGAEATQSFTETGVQAVTLRVRNERGEDQITKLVPVVTGSLDDHYDAIEDTLLSVPAETGVLANDGAAGTLTASVGQDPGHGELNLASDGSFTYAPDQDYCGDDAFDYTMTDANDFTDSAVATLVVECVNDPPVAADDTLEVTEDAAQSVAAPGLLAKVTDPDIGDVRTVTIVDQPAHGHIDLDSSDGSYTYTPDRDYCGSDSFTYQANDGTVDSNNATVTINVTCVNDVPVAANDSYRTTVDTPLSVPAPGVLANDTDVENGLASVAELDTDVSHGNLQLAADGSFTYTPDAGFAGTDSFSYFPGDGTDFSPVSAMVTILVSLPGGGPRGGSSEQPPVTDPDIDGLGASDSICPPKPFPDVAASNPFCADISWLKAQHITRGYMDGTFRPAGTMTRQAMAAFIHRWETGSTSDPACTSKPFPDVSTDNPFCGTISWMKDRAITRGYTDDTFRPAGTMTRQAMAAFIHRWQTAKTQP